MTQQLYSWVFTQEKQKHISIGKPSMDGHSSIIYYKQLGEVKWMKLKSLSCVQLCDLMDYTVHVILQARILEWVAVPFSRGSSQSRDGTQVSHIAGGFFTIWATRADT